MIRSAGPAAIAYLLASTLLTWPVALQPRSLLFGDYGDTRGWARWVWAKSQGFLDGPLDPLLAAPFGAPISIITHPIPDGMVVALARISGEIAAINLVVVLSFALTALGTYLLMHRLLDDRPAAFLAGLGFGFCPAAVMQAAGGHSLYALNVFIPLFVLALFHNRSRRTPLSASLVAAAFAAVTLTAIYFGYFALFIALFFVAFDLSVRDAEPVRAIVRNYALCAILAAAILLPFEYPLIHEQLTASREATSKAGHLRDFGELAVFSAKPWNYLVPSMDHPVLGNVVTGYVRANLHGSNAFEQTLYLGFVPLGLILLGLGLVATGRFEAGLRRHFYFFGLAAVFMYFLSLPPLLGRAVPNLSYFAYDVVPMFRVYARLGILVAFFVMCAAAVVVVHLSHRMTRARYHALVAVLTAAVAFEFWSVPPAHALPVDEPPQVYRWLAAQPGDFIVAEYPMAQFDEAAFYSFAFWQRLHGKRLANGASPDNPRAWELYEKIADLSEPQTPRLLKSAGVKYVILHKRMYEEGPIPTPLKRYYSPARAALKFNGGIPPTVSSGLRLHRAFGSDLVFEIE